MPTRAILSKNAIPAPLNAAVTLSVVAFHALVLIVLPLWLLPQSMHWAWLMLPFAWVHSTHWALIHEGIHKLLHPNAKINELMGRTLSVLLGSSFAILRFGHLIHHQLNRDWHSEYVEQRSVSAKITYYANLTFGLYLSEMVSSLVFTFMPRPALLWFARNFPMHDYPDVIVSGERFFYARNNIASVRVDTMAFLLIYGVAFWLYGAYWPVLIGFIALRAAVISLMDNIYHYGTPADNSRASKELALPRAISAMILHSNYHETHHLNPSIPWIGLPADNARSNRGFDGNLVTHGLVQFAGPILHAVRT